MNIEAELTKRTPAGAKLHTGRSRNDQVALDMRMWLRDEIALLSRELRDLQLALVEPRARQVPRQSAGLVRGAVAVARPPPATGGIGVSPRGGGGG